MRIGKRSERAAERARSRLCLAVLVVVFVLALAGGATQAHPSALAVRSSSAASAGGARSDGVSFVGRVRGTNAFIGIYREGDRALAYVCDNAQTAVWLRGTISAGRVRLTSDDGARVAGRLEGGEFSGAFTPVEGDTRNVRAKRATGSAGIYRLETTAAVDTPPTSVPLVFGWVVLPGERQRGALVCKTCGSSLTVQAAATLTNFTRSDAQPAGTGFTATPKENLNFQQQMLLSEATYHELVATQTAQRLNSTTCANNNCNIG